jgi:hypothetical protein
MMWLVSGVSRSYHVSNVAMATSVTTQAEATPRQFTSEHDLRMALSLWLTLA